MISYNLTTSDDKKVALPALCIKNNHEVGETNVEQSMINCVDKGTSGTECSGNNNKDISGRHQKQKHKKYA